MIRAKRFKDKLPFVFRGFLGYLDSKFLLGIYGETKSLLKLLRFQVFLFYGEFDPGSE